MVYLSLTPGEKSDEPQGKRRRSARENMVPKQSRKDCRHHFLFMGGTMLRLKRQRQKTRAVSRTRKLGGKSFVLHDWYMYKPAAIIAADNLRRRGYLVRITFRPKSKRPGGYPLYNLWYIWKKKQ
jgi:hypothetical protein